MQQQSAFFLATVIGYDNDYIGANVEESGDNIVGKDDFKLGIDVHSKCGKGRNEAAQNINTVEVNGAKLHKFQLSDGTLTEVPACHLQLLEHPDFTNIPVDVETYCKEVEAGLTTEDIAALARPQSLSPLHKEFLFGHHHQYHMPNHRMIQLSKECMITHRLDVLEEKPPICASSHVGRAHKRS